MNGYVDLFMKEDMIGREGILGEIGLIALPDDRRNAMKNSVAKYTKLTLDDLSE